jgi:hypothetical protein
MVAFSQTGAVSKPENVLSCTPPTYLLSAPPTYHAQDSDNEQNVAHLRGQEREHDLYAATRNCTLSNLTVLDMKRKRKAMIERGTEIPNVTWLIIHGNANRGEFLYLVRPFFSQSAPPNCEPRNYC